MRVLLFAPRTNLLYVDSEVQWIMRSELDVVPVLGPVTYPVFFDEVTRSDFDVLWLCTHGTSEGIVLSDGILKTADLVTIVRGRFSLIVLNTCESINVAQQLQNGGEAEVIATITPVPDQQAFVTGAAFALALAKFQDSGAAFTAARPGNNSTYVRLAGSGKKK